MNLLHCDSEAQWERLVFGDDTLERIEFVMSALKRPASERMFVFEPPVDAKKKQAMKSLLLLVGMLLAIVVAKFLGLKQ